MVFKRSGGDGQADGASLVSDYALLRPLDAATPRAAPSHTTSSALLSGEHF
jgi:hypothetical protein